MMHHHYKWLSLDLYTELLQLHHCPWLCFCWSQSHKMMRYCQVLILRYWSNSKQVCIDFKENSHVSQIEIAITTLVLLLSPRHWSGKRHWWTYEPFTHPLNGQTQTEATWGAQFYPISNTASKHNAYILNNEVNICFLGFKVNSQHITKCIWINKTFSRHTITHN
jgi:hypothetical protein